MVELLSPDSTASTLLAPPPRPEETPLTDPRQEALLEAAVGVFARYGFRKTSMDEVARAAGVSRQGLYLLFADKEALFRRAVAHKLAGQLRAAAAELANTAAPLESRLVAACDEWAGRYVGVTLADAADLMCASTSLAGSTLAHYEAKFQEALASAVGASPLAAYCADAGLDPSTSCARLARHGPRPQTQL